MTEIRKEWDDAPPARKGYLVHQYSDLHRRYVPKVTDEMIKKTWEAEIRRTKIAKLFEAFRRQTVPLASFGPP